MNLICMLGISACMGATLCIKLDFSPWTEVFEEINSLSNYNLQFNQN